MQPKLRFASFLAIGLLTLASAVGDGAAMEPIKLKIAAIGSPPALQNMFIHVAQDEGFFAKHGIVVDEVLKLRAGPLATQALSAGRIDVTETDAEGVLNAAVAGGFNGIAIAAPAQHVSYVVAVRNEIGSIKDMAGKTFAISRPGALSQYMLFPMLDAEGMKRDQITWVPIGGANERMIALMADRVKGTLIHFDFALAAQRDGKVRVLDRIARVAPDYPQELLVIRKDLAEKRPDVAVAVVKAIMEACRFIASNRERTLELFEKHGGDTDRSVSRAAYDELMKIHGFGVNGGMSRKGLDAVTSLAVANGAIPKAPPLASWADFRFQDDALGQIGAVAE